MTKQNRKMRGLLIFPLLALAAMSCVLTGPRFEVGELLNERHSVEYSGANAISADIEMGLGDLHVAGGADDLLEGESTFNVEELRPKIDFDGEQLNIHTAQVEVGFDSFWDMDEFRNEWDLSFSDEVAMDMVINLGAGNAQLDLGSLKVYELQLDAGAGNMHVDLSGSSTLTELSVDAGVGAITIDLRGDWPQGLRAEIRAGVGDITIWLPSGLDHRGRSYFNAVYGESDSEIIIRIDAGVSKINLIVAE